MTVKTIRCAVYTRKSSEEGLEQDFNSLHAQREACEAYILSQKHEGWQLVKTHYDDGGFSGGNMNRPALTQLMKDIEAGKVDVIVVYKVDRLSRSLHDFARMVEIFDKHNVSFVSITQQFNTTTSMGRLTLNVLLSFAQFEREVTGERIRDKIAASKKKGMWMGGVVPLGYDVKERKLVINIEEAERVRYMFRRYLDLGSVRALRDEMEQKGILGKIRKRESRALTGDSRGAIYRLLSNHYYLGQVHFKGAHYDGQHEAIIEQEIWDKVQQSLSNNKGESVGEYSRVGASLLNKRLFDAMTGEPLLPVHAKKNGRRYRYYVSLSLLRNNVSAGASGWRLPGTALEKAVYGIIRSALSQKTQISDSAIAAGVSTCYVPELLAKAQLIRLQPDEALDALARKVSIRKDGIEVELTLNPLLPDKVEHNVISLTVSKPILMQRRGSETRLSIPGTDLPTQAIDNILVTSIARAHVWAEEILSGKTLAMTDIAIREKVSDSYVKKVMPLAFLAPDIVTAILAGRQPAHLTNQMMIRHMQVPLDWQEQRRVFGFPIQAQKP